jgi:hypothetical protein
MRTERPGGVIDRVPRGPNVVQPEGVRVWDAGSVELATWIISEANKQAADIRHEARDMMSTSLADAKQEAGELVRKAAEQAAATLEAAELRAAEIRAAVAKLSVELNGVAAQVTENLVGFAPPTKPFTSPVVQPVAEPAIQPVAERATKPRTGPARSKGQPRQLVAIRVAAAATAALVLFAVVSAVAEVSLHGFQFFVFRSTGTGETGPNGLPENEGPGQPDAAKPTPSHIKAQSGPHSTITVHNG